MKKKLINELFCNSLLYVMVLIATSTILGQGDQPYPWEKVVLFSTTREQIEEYFGKPLLDDPLISSVHDTKFGKITAWYGRAKSPDGLKCNWEISEDVVLSFAISLADPIPVSKFRYGLSKFERSQSHLNRIIYTSLEKGISLAADKSAGRSEQIVLIQYFPDAFQIKRHCSN